MVENRASSSLSPRELQITRFIAQGLTNGEISGKLYLSVYTVRNEVGNILRKLDLRNRTQIASSLVLDEGRFIPLAEAATLSGLSHVHLRWLARNGKLEATRRGRDWFTTKTAIDLYLRNEAVRKYDPYKRERLDSLISNE